MYVLHCHSVSCSHLSHLLQHTDSLRVKKSMTICLPAHWRFEVAVLQTFQAWMGSSSVTAIPCHTLIFVSSCQFLLVTWTSLPKNSLFSLLVSRCFMVWQKPYGSHTVGGNSKCSTVRASLLFFLFCLLSELALRPTVLLRVYSCLDLGPENRYSLTCIVFVNCFSFPSVRMAVTGGWDNLLPLHSPFRCAYYCTWAALVSPVVPTICLSGTFFSVWHRHYLSLFLSLSLSLSLSRSHSLSLSHTHTHLPLGSGFSNRTENYRLMIEIAVPVYRSCLTVPVNSRGLRCVCQSISILVRKGAFPCWG